MHIKARQIIIHLIDKKNYYQWRNGKKDKVKYLSRKNYNFI